MFLTKRSKLSELQFVRKRVNIFGLFYNLYNNAWELLFSLFEGDIKKTLQIHIALLQQINCSML